MHVPDMRVTTYGTLHIPAVIRVLMAPGIVVLCRKFSPVLRTYTYVGSLPMLA
jgi:hypothetical protein